MVKENILGTICARGGSKGTPGKNVREIAGKPLIVHTIELALRVPSISRVVVSTDPEHRGDLRGLGQEVRQRDPFTRRALPCEPIPAMNDQVGVSLSGLLDEGMEDLDCVLEAPGLVDMRV